jgi:uncharacterized protein (DUF2252 family)
MTADPTTQDALCDVVASIQAFNAGREPRLLAMKYDRLRLSPFVFLRGACHLFFDRLAPLEPVVASPLAWACGDLHLENFGSYKGDNGLTYLDINDFDESALAPAHWDLLRCLTSLLLAAKQFDASPAKAARVGEAFMAAYATALAQGSARWIERSTAQGLVGDLLESLRRRTQARLLDRYCDAGLRRRSICCDGKKALAIGKAERKRVGELIVGGVEQASIGSFDIVDVARHIAGTASLGLDRYVALVRVGKAASCNYQLLDLKQARASSLLRHLGNLQPAWESPAHRQVAIERRMQAVPMALLHPVVDGAQSWVLRAIQPSEDRVDLSAPGVTLAQVRGVVEDMGRLLAWAQLRSSGRQGAATADALIDFGARHAHWSVALLNASKLCADQVRRDWKTWRRAATNTV